MFIKQAINLDSRKATNQELFQATVNLKARFERSNKALSKRNIKTALMKSVNARIETRPELFNKPMGKLTRSELQYVYDTYRQYSGNYYNGEWKLNKTSTLKGYRENQKNIGEKVLGNAEYSKWSKEQQNEMWDKVEMIRAISPSFFGLGSEKGIKSINVMVTKDGLTDINDIIDGLKQQANEFINKQFNDINPFEL